MGARRGMAAVAVAGLLLVGCGPDGASEEATAPSDAAAGDAEEATPSPTLGARLHPELDGREETEVRVSTGDREHRLQAVLATTPAQRRRGLMDVEHLPEGTGMLFLHPEPTEGGYWMRNTLVPLEIAYARGDGEIVGVRTMEPCRQEDCPSYPPAAPYRVALEVPAGWLSDRDVAAGDRLAWGPAPEPR